MNGVETQFGWRDPDESCAHRYLLPAVLAELAGKASMKVLDIGCGNGYVTAKIAGLGHDIVGMDVSRDGIEIARATHPGIRFELASVYDAKVSDLAGLVDCVVALEVLEHLFFPRQLFAVSYEVLRPNGVLILSTPYHGYLKNLAISILNGWDRHFAVEHDGGHIKFFSKRSLERMAVSCGFRRPRCRGVGRIPFVWKSMVMVAEK
jgi:2-polyprenyl-3-methyl-5-hydroxy-6-metoxy-1,4-benzoquinol methylase